LLLPLAAKFLEKNKKIIINFFIHNYFIDLVNENIKEGQLKVVLPSHEVQQYKVYAYYHRAAQAGGLVMTYIDYLRQELRN